MYHKDIFNNEHIEFVNKHGQLPYDLNSPENRAAVSEYINTQLDGGNITEAQRESLKNLQQEIRDFEEPLFIQEVEKYPNGVKKHRKKLPNVWRSGTVKIMKDNSPLGTERN